MSPHAADAPPLDRASLVLLVRKDPQRVFVAFLPSLPHLVCVVAVVVVVSEDRFRWHACPPPSHRAVQAGAPLRSEKGTAGGGPVAAQGVVPHAKYPPPQRRDGGLLSYRAAAFFLLLRHQGACALTD